jgi:flagellar biosynthetic protein FliR
MSFPSLSWLVENYHQQLVITLLVLARLVGLVVTVPVLGTPLVPVRIRIALAAALCVFVAPLHWETPSTAALPPLGVFSLFLHDFAVGLALGLAVRIVLSGFLLSGFVASHMSGLALSDAFSVGANANVPLLSHLYQLAAISVFVLIGGHRIVLSGLLDSFRWMPPGTVGISDAAASCVAEILTQSFLLGIRTAAPILVALFSTLLLMGLVGRTLPQLNVLSIGLGFNSIITLAVMSVTLGAVTWVFQDHFEAALSSVWRMFDVRG